MDVLLYIVLIIVGFFVVMNLFVWISGFLKKGKKIDELSGELGAGIKAGNKLLVYFYSPSCGACKAMTPVVEEMSRKNSNIFKINVARDWDIARKFGVMGTPATILVENSKISKYILGARNEQFLRGLL
jgi:thioredoxin 1